MPPPSSPPRYLTFADALRERHVAALALYAEGELRAGPGVRDALVCVRGEEVLGPLTEAGMDPHAAAVVAQALPAPDPAPDPTPPAVDPLALPRVLLALHTLNPAHPLLAGQSETIAPLLALQGAIRAVLDTAPARRAPSFREALEALERAAVGVYGNGSA